MVKRLLSCTASEVKKMTPMELKQAIKASEGRIICSENVAISQSVAGDITNAELASAYGADLILLNTCAIRENAEEKVFGKVGYVKNLKKKNY